MLTEKYPTFFLLSSLAVRSSSVFCTSWLATVLLSGTSCLSSASSRSCSSWSMALSRFLRCSRLAFFSSFILCLWYADILTKQWEKNDLGCFSPASLSAQTENILGTQNYNIMPALCLLINRWSRTIHWNISKIANMAQCNIKTLWAPF